MVDTTVALSSIEVVIGIASAMVAAIAWQYRTERVGRPIVVMAVATTLYALITALQSFVTDPVWWRLVNNSGYPLGATLAVSSLYAVGEFTERESLQRPVVGGLFVGFILLDFLAAITDPFHKLMNTSVQLVDGVAVGAHGPLYFVHTVGSLSIVGVAIGLLLVEYPATSGVYRRQTIVAIGAFIFAMSGFIIESFASIHPALDVATVGMFGWCSLILWGMFTADFLDLVPIGRTRAVRSIDDPVVTLDENDRVVDSNPAARQLSAVDSGWEGTPLASFFRSHPELVSAIETADTPGGGDVTLDIDGEPMHVTLSVSSIYRDERAQRSPLGCTVVMRDVTELVARQQELEATNQQLESARNRYRSLFENTPLVVWEEDLSETITEAKKLAAKTDDIVDYLADNPAEHRRLFETVEVVDVNENAVDAYGASSKAELIERLGELLTEESMATNRRLIKRLLDGDRRFREETTYQRLDGELRYELLDVFVPDTHAEDCSRVLIAATNITERKQREEELQYQTALFEAITESINAGVLVASTDREILWYNSQFRELWELSEERLDSGDCMAVTEFVAEQLAEPERFTTATEELYELPYESHQQEFRLADGRWIDRYTTPIVDDEGTHYGLLTLVRDITDRKQYETRIETQNQWLERLAEVISHDLRTPLTTADNHLKLLEMELDEPAPPVAESLADLEATHDRLRQFTEHLPQLARESTDVGAPIECELATVARDGWDVVDTRSLSLVVTQDGTLRADPKRLQQVFENLFENAVEHATGGDDAATTVRVGVCEDGFYVADDGPGVSPEQGQEVFKYGMSTGEGSGIGLAIVRNIVEAHGWDIRVEHATDGARFVIETSGAFDPTHESLGQESNS
jgi:PAS domain S-box-containing protein